MDFIFKITYFILIYTTVVKIAESELSFFLFFIFLFLELRVRVSDNITWSHISYIKQGNNDGHKSQDV